MTLTNSPKGNGGAEALRVAQRFWPADERRRMELDRLVRQAAATLELRVARAAAGRTGGQRAAAKPRPRPGWVCSSCGALNKLFAVCIKCRAAREAPRPR